MANHSATLTWTASVDTVNGYNVYRGLYPPSGDEGATPINGTTLVSGTTYIDTTVGVGQAYDYYVTAVANGVESVHSAEVHSTVILPAPPTALQITATS